MILNLIILLIEISICYIIITIEDELYTLIWLNILEVRG